MEMNATAAAEPSWVSALLRRVGMTAGFSFGFLLLALAVAGEANASEESDPSSLDQVAGSLGELVTPLSEGLSGVTEPVGEVVDSTTEVTEPVLTPVTETVEEVVTPVTETVEPVTQPVLEPVSSTLSPVVESLSPLVEPITEPVLDAGEPVLDPVSEAVGVEPIVSALEPEATPSVPHTPADAQPEAKVQPEPQPEPKVQPEPQPTLERQYSVQAVSPDTATTSRDASADERRSDLPQRPFGPAGELAIGVATAAGGSSGSHAADSAVTTAWPSTRLTSVADPGSSYADFVAQWHGYDDRDHPG
jgi:hypothetical protein